ncbi:THxN family PEP-CTERM protein [Thermaurantiacus tibetensis]|uniref:THxN family PEP-CTERM protein n=1 Tax=Thermaurantiacus tibetensis TaxID=2759035 RepID=UPI00188FA725|nr:THxN family PEP-CTERM protein [Thermaurantiacus tibetensis]
MRLATALAAAALGFAALPAMASTTIDFTNIRATWFDTVGGAAVNFTGNGTGTAEVRWGTGGSQSGYRFEAIGIPTLVVDPLTDTSAVTSIGRFTHLNFPISAGTAISAVKLRFTTDVLVNGLPFGTVDFIYAFDHFETPNGANPCADGNPNGTPPNQNGCADRVAVNFNQASGFFTIGTVDYALDVRGFLIGGSPASQFWTVENASNEAFIRGQVVLRDNAGVIPEPGTWAMLIAGFGMIGAAARRRTAAPARVSA